MAWLPRTLDTPNPTLRQVLQHLHSPMAGPLQAGPGHKQWCRGCGGVMAWPCLTRRLLDGQVTDVVSALRDTRPVGAPYRFNDDVEVAG